MPFVCVLTALLKFTRISSNYLLSYNVSAWRLIDWFKLSPIKKGLVWWRTEDWRFNDKSHTKWYPRCTRTRLSFLKVPFRISFVLPSFLSYIFLSFLFILPYSFSKAIQIRPEEPMSQRTESCTPRVQEPLDCTQQPLPVTSSTSKPGSTWRFRRAYQTNCVHSFLYYLHVCTRPRVGSISIAAVRNVCSQLCQGPQKKHWYF